MVAVRQDYAAPERGWEFYFVRDATTMSRRRRWAKAVEGHRSPRRSAFTGRLGLRASVVECGGPPPLFPSASRATSL